MYAIIERATGEACSFASVVGDLPSHLEAVEVDGLPDGRPWDALKRAYGERPAPRKSRRKRAQEAFAAATTIDQKVDALAIMLGVKD